MSTIDNRVVEMQFDNKQFEQNVQTSMSTIGKLKNSLNFSGAEKGFQNIDAAAKKCDMSALGGAVQSIQAGFSTLEVMAITALANITNTAVNAGKKIASALIIEPITTGFQEYETQINSVQTILANTSAKGTTLNQVNAALDELNLYADKTIYNFTQMTRNIGTFTAAGVDLKTSVSAIKGIANLAAVSGSTSQQASTAMYQLSQALASGTVKLMDWNSVVNAGMGGQVFQDSLKETARLHGIAIDDMIKSEGSFRETLQKGWLSSEILTETLSKFTGDLSEAQLTQMGYTQEQIKEILKLGTMANDAATKVKTLSQLWDTLKESAQSGWSQSWKIIVGDFEEAKEFFTEVSNSISTVLSESSDARNELLSGTLSSGWDQLLKQGITDEAGYVESIKEVAKEQGVAIDELIVKEGSFEKALKTGKITSDILSKALGKLADKTKGLSDKELEALGYTRAQIDSLEKFNDVVQNGSLSMDTFADKMSGLSGRELLIDTLRNSFEALMSVAKVIKIAFSEIFPPITAERLYEIIEGIREFSKKLKPSMDTLLKIKATFKGLFAILDIVGQAFGAIFKAISPVRNVLSGFGSSVLDITAAWGKWLTDLDQSIRYNDTFGQAIQKVVSFVKNAASAIRDFAIGVKDFFVDISNTPVVKQLVDNIKSLVSVIKERFVFPGFEVFHNFLERLQERLSQVGEFIGGFSFNVVGAFNSVGDSLQNSKFVTFLSALWRGVKTIAGGIVKALGEVFSGLVDTVSNADFDGAIDFLNAITLGGVGAAIKGFFDNAKKLISDGDGIVGKFKDVLDGIKGCLEGFQEKLKSEVIFKIASAIGILAASILVISTIDSDKLAASIGALTALFGELVGAMAIFDKIGGKSTSLAKACGAMVSVSTSVLILATALRVIGSLDTGKMFAGLVGVTALLGGVVGAATILGQQSGRAMKGASQLILLAFAVKILASVCKDLSELSWEGMAKGLLGVGLLLGEIALFTNNAAFNKRAISSSLGILVLSAAIKVLASACSDFSQLSWENLGKGLAAITVLLGEIVAFTKFTGNTKNLVSVGIGMIAIAAAMKIFASAIQDLSSMSWEQLAVGLSGMAGALLAVVAAVNFLPKNMIGIGLGLIAVSTAMVILASALGKFGNMTWDSIARGLVAFGGSIAILAIGLNAMNGTLSGSAALLVAAISLSILAPVLSLMGAMSWEGIAKGLVVLAGAFAVIGVAGLALTPLVPTMLGLAGAFALVGLAVLGIGTGLLAAGAGLGALAAGFAALATLGTAGATAVAASLTIIITGIVGLIPAIIGKIGEGIVALCVAIGDSTVAIGRAFKAVVLTLIDVLVECVPALADGALQIVVGLLEALVSYTPQIVDSIFGFIIGVLQGIARNVPELIVSVVDILISVFEGVIAALKSIDPETLANGLAGVGLLTALMAALAASAALAPAAMIGVLAVGGVITELAFVLSAIGNLTQIPGLTYMIDEGAEMLGHIGNAIGSFIGGIAGGVVEGVTSAFPKVGEDLSGFMKNAEPFIEGAKGIDASVMDGVKALAETILILTGANVLDGIASWITGESSLTKFGQELEDFGPHFKKYATSISGINANDIESSAKAVKALGEMAGSLPNHGGVVSWFAGDNEGLAAFGKELSDFGPDFKKYSDSIKGLDTGIVENSANAAGALAKLNDLLPDHGGVAGWINGDNKGLAAFGEELEAFGPHLKSYAESVTGLDPNVIENTGNAAQALAKLNESIPQISKVEEFFCGNQGLEAFGKSLVAFGKAFADYYDEVKDVDAGILESTTSLADSLVALEGKLPPTGWEWFKELQMNSFKKNLVALGEGIADFVSKVIEVDSTNLSVSIAQVNKIVDLFVRLSELDYGGATSFAESLTALAGVNIDNFVGAFSDSYERIKMAATLLMANFIAGMEEQTEPVTLSFSGILTKVIGKIEEKLVDFYTFGQTIITRIIVGAASKTRDILKAFNDTIALVVSTIRDKYSDFYSAGGYLVEGFASGISANTYIAEARARAMAAAAAAAASAELEINSPSKVGYGIGNYFGMGFVNAITDYVAKAYSAGKDMAVSAKQGLSSAIMRISDFVADGIDSQPTIRPVLDLSDVRKGAEKLNAIFSSTQALSISADMNSSIKHESDSGSDNAPRSTAYSFVQNNYSPKPLSRLAIYRQTKNLISTMKGLA